MKITYLIRKGLSLFVLFQVASCGLKSPLLKKESSEKVKSPSTESKVRIPLATPVVAIAEKEKTSSASGSIPATTSPLIVATPISNMLREVSDIFLGDEHSCALSKHGTVFCWGWNSSGQLGDGTSIDRAKPVAVQGLESGVKSVSLGTYHSCAVSNSGGVKCWGHNGAGQLGDGSRSHRKNAVEVIGLLNGVSKLALGSYHSCALLLTGGVKCWGQGSSGQLGNGTRPLFGQDLPTEVTGLDSGVKAISAGGTIIDGQTCALLNSGKVKCWGANIDGQLGNGTTTNALTPTDVVNISSDVVSISGGNSFNCAASSTGVVKCWGENFGNELGSGSISSLAQPLPIQVGKIFGEISSLASGGSHSCLVDSVGETICWGRNYEGQLGTGTDEASRDPSAIKALGTNVAKVAAGGSHTCALMKTGDLKCWGYNERGQLGDGSKISSSRPVSVIGPHP